MDEPASAKDPARADPGGVPEPGSTPAATGPGTGPGGEAAPGPPWAPQDLIALADAKRRLEYPSLAIRIADAVGSPIEAGFRMLPRGWQRKASGAVENALLTGLEFSVRTMGRNARRGSGMLDDGADHAQGAGAAAHGLRSVRRGLDVRSHDWLHRALVIGTGTAGGAVGLAALPVELPISTVVMLRSIADIARAEGHDLSRLEVRLSCLEVFALGGKGHPADEAAETGYWAVRTALSQQMTAAARSIAERGFADASAPAVIRLIQKIAPRFGAVVSEQLAAKAVPVIGALSGGAVNYLFMTHFQDIARGHFVVKRLENTYGPEAVRWAYAKVRI